MYILSDVWILEDPQECYKNLIAQYSKATFRCGTGSFGLSLVIISLPLYKNTNTKCVYNYIYVNIVYHYMFFEHFII